MRHEHEIAGFEPVVMQRVVVDLAQDGASADAVGRIVLVDELTQTIHDLLAVHPAFGKFELEPRMKNGGSNNCCFEALEVFF